MTRTRKPLRRTAWGMTIVGGALSALMLGGGALAVSGGQPAGPGQEATWPAGETVELTSLQELGYTSTTCTVTPRGRPAEDPWPHGIDRPLTPDFTGPATITCDEPVVLLTGTRLVVSDFTRSPLVTLPVFVTLLGLACFVPRFTYLWASLYTSGWMRKMVKIPPPKI
ncbi:hypothetical protein [Actinophytocola gossypii]|uniref:Uncharacterized protein n=1 Tax=Actinophytocola gossypii TaxID=2812003 RepID=A0ABT2J8B2_9PSEU|nr:hypothetical protein [Actinophytocola gossypii]MCT2583720.1 hypothetical protein [Actinophytocola gossypii]